MGASRTDSGTHALAQRAHFDCDLRVPLERLPRVINKVLPLDLSVLDACEVNHEFHARFSAVSRSYRYRIRTGIRTPFASRYAYDTHYHLDTEKMNRVAQGLIGTHDFFAFSEEVPRGVNGLRELKSIEVKAVGSETWINIKGNAFMRGMMRRISGGLFELGIGRRSEQDFLNLIDPIRREEIEWPQVLPARGLCLHQVRYGRHPKDLRNKFAKQNNPGQSDQNDE